MIINKINMLNEEIFSEFLLLINIFKTYKVMNIRGKKNLDKFLNLAISFSNIFVYIIFEQFYILSLIKLIK